MKKQTIKSLDNLTVVILTHNRQHCLEKVLDFWESEGINSIVVDESPKPLADAGRFSRSKYIYCEAPFRIRCMIASENINTSYSVVISDDELYLPSSLAKMISIIENDSKIMSVGGPALAVWKYGPLTAGSWPYRETHKIENREKTPFARIKKHTNDGQFPKSTFFTSNVTRSELLFKCLNLYGKSPTIATEAISTLVICGGGESVYSDALYWIRNWNQYPRSHKGWNRNMPIHKWWEQQKQSANGFEFEKELSNVFFDIAKTNDVDSFQEIWGMILSSSKIADSEPQRRLLNYVSWSDAQWLRYAKYSIKRATKRMNDPKEYKSTLQEMKEKEVSFDENEVKKAVQVVSKLFPYRNWG